MEMQGQQLGAGPGQGPGHMGGSRMASMQLTPQQQQAMMAQQHQAQMMMGHHNIAHAAPGQGPGMPMPPGATPAQGGPPGQGQVIPPGGPGNPHQSTTGPPPPQQQQHGQGPPGVGQDNISRAKSLMPSMRESIAVSIHIISLIALSPLVLLKKMSA